MIESLATRLTPTSFYDVYCETLTCLPDAVELLTPCTVGNGWLKVLDVGRFALCFYDKATGQGFRSGVNLKALEAWPELAAWFLKRRPKAQQDTDLVFREMEEAGTDVFSVRPIQVAALFLGRKASEALSVCPVCGETYPASHGPACRACSRGLPYAELVRSENG